MSLAPRPILKRARRWRLPLPNTSSHTRAWCLISTHHTSLKVYAANTPGVLNAAVGFNEQTLAPTYELRQGVPGASAGINIASRLGLNPQIIDSARSRLNTQTQDISRFLDQLHAPDRIHYRRARNTPRCASRKLRARKIALKSKV